MKLYTIEELLSNPKEYIESTWFYLPPDKNNWTLKTEGVFSLDSRDFEPDSEEYLPKQVEEDGWIETVEGPEIDDIVFNATEQIENPTMDDLFNAFVYYIENDAFLEF